MGLMRIAAAVLTHNPVRHRRTVLLRDTIESLIEGGATVAIIDNGSTDDSTDLLHELVSSHHVELVRNNSRITTSGAGTNLQARWCEATDADLCVLSDDDMWWHDGWARHLMSWWQQAPPAVLLTGAHLEPMFAWNTIVDVQPPALIRTSTGAASWTFRRGTWTDIGPVPRTRQGWSDVPACRSIVERGWQIAQLDCAEHRGISTWANGSSTFDDDAIARVRRLLT